MALSTVCLDTSGYSALMKGIESAAAVLEAAESILVPAVVLGELHAGFAMGGRREKNREMLARFLQEPGCSIVQIGHEVAERYGQIVHQLRRQGTPIPTNDIWVAAVAMHAGAYLLSYDEHFKEIPLLPLLP